MISLRILAALATASGLCAAAAAASNDSAFPEAGAPAPSEAERPPTFEFARMRSRLVGGDKIGWTESGLFCSHRVNVGANSAAPEVGLDAGRRHPANAAALRNAAATVMHDNVSGSAFYVADGYLLTNHHVVGNAHYVKVKLASGQVLVGEVLRDDVRRDVALIKTEPAGVTPLHVNMAEPAVGSDVFAIGSPLGQELAGTFTRGVLSGTRAHDGLEYLQSNAAVNPGNSGGPLLDASSSVIGMTVLKINQAAGLSFFIPIRDAANAVQPVFD